MKLTWLEKKNYSGPTSWSLGLAVLGSAATPYLAAAGIGTITLIDFDAVELTNLQRQIMHTKNSVGSSKVDSDKRFLEALNPAVHITFIQITLVSGSALRLDSQLSVLDVKHAGSPCYACIFPPDHKTRRRN